MTLESTALLQQPTVHHQLDLTISYAAGAGLQAGDETKGTRVLPSLSSWATSVRTVSWAAVSLRQKTTQAAREQPPFPASSHSRSLMYREVVTGK